MKFNDFLPSLKIITKNENEKPNQVVEIRFKATCPKCKKGKFDYDGLLNLVCQNCGFTSAGCFT
ncbi:MAG: hypothetical protein BGO78_17830 [Chloroflexi bacterium 44-23]|nr:MAG: hypothetical protein BGO78_17830 [Chloroflexi bacterium 44-23]